MKRSESVLARSISTRRKVNTKMSINYKSVQAFAFSLLSVVAAPCLVSAVDIPVPNGDFNDNSDGDLLDVDIWDDGCCALTEVLQVDNALGKAAGDLVMRIGGLPDFVNPTINTGVTFDSTSIAYVVSVEARAFSDAALTSSSGIATVDDDWGIVFRDLTNGQNIKQTPNTIAAGGPSAIDSWQTFTLGLSQAEMLQYESNSGNDIDLADIGIRFFKTVNTPFYIALDNVTLSTLDLAADVDGDGDVDLIETDDDMLSDYDIIRNNLLMSSATFGQGDVFPIGSGDGVVDLSDFRVWKNEFLALGGTIQEIEAYAASLAVPEPTAGVLTSVALMAIALNRSARKQKRA